MIALHEWIGDEETKEILRANGFDEEDIPGAFEYMETYQLLVRCPTRGPVMMWYDDCVFWVGPIGRD
jgi:hypothetical protein